jgi:competence protein ComFC
MPSFSFLLDLVFPPVCVSCGKFNEMLCSTCRQRIIEVKECICPHCLKNCVDGSRHAQCKGSIDGLTSFWEYEGVASQVIKAIKYSHFYSVVPVVMRIFFEYCEKAPIQPIFDFIKEKPIVVPVPLYKQRYRVRGFNQSSLIGKEIAKHWKLPFSEKILVRHLQTKPQAELGKKDRLNNVKHAFSPSKEVSQLGLHPLKAKNILLIDDVWTTGATMQACAKVLKNLGAEKIWAVTLAR